MLEFVCDFRHNIKIFTIYFNVLNCLFSIKLKYSALIIIIYLPNSAACYFYWSDSNKRFINLKNNLIRKIYLYMKLWLPKVMFFELSHYASFHCSSSAIMVSSHEHIRALFAFHNKRVFVKYNVCNILL